MNDSFPMLVHGKTLNILVKRGPNWIDQEICRQRKIFLFRKLSLSIPSTFSILVVIKGTMANRESTLKTMNMLGAAFQGQLLIGCAIKEFCRSDRQPLHLLGNFVH